MISVDRDLSSGLITVVIRGQQITLTQAEAEMLLTFLAVVVG